MVTRRAAEVDRGRGPRLRVDPPEAARCSSAPTISVRPSRRGDDAVEVVARPQRDAGHVDLPGAWSNALDTIEDALRRESVKYAPRAVTVRSLMNVSTLRGAKPKRAISRPVRAL